MKKILAISALVIANTCNILGNNELGNISDTLRTRMLDEVVITSSFRETNHPANLPASVSFISMAEMEDGLVISIKDLSAAVPNFFIPDYGSKLSVPVYIRGIGERSTGQPVGMYVDNTPLPDKSAFDFEFTDISRIEILRGPQGTLYGRNAMSGMINIVTPSPLREQYTRAMLSAGNYGQFRAKATVAQLLAPKVGIAVNGYYDRNDGYFTNTFLGEKADHLQSGGARFRLDWKFNPEWTVQWAAYYDRTSQGAFPYGIYSGGKIAEPAYNDPGRYLRTIAGSSLNLNYRNEALIFNSNTAFQYLDDDMKMDTDYSPLDAFFIHQTQNGRIWTEEITLKSNTDNKYQWSFGTLGFYNDLTTECPVDMKTDGIGFLQTVFNDLKAEYPQMPLLRVTDAGLRIPGRFETPAYGIAAFHQSTYNHLFIDNLSLTAGIRLDYEKQQMRYSSTAKMHLWMHLDPIRPGMPPIDQDISGTYEATVMDVDIPQDFLELLPKLALKYELGKRRYVYLSIAKGYKTGGYNIQNSKDVMQAQMQYDVIKTYESSFPNGIDRYVPAPVEEKLVYKPEHSWNYEIGYKGQIINNLLDIEIAAYCIDVKNIQLTDFAESGQGRLLKNAGKARSLGAELTLNAQLSPGFRLTLDYGFTKAVFRDYQIKNTAGDVVADFNGKRLPFAPQNTLALGAAYDKKLKNQWIDAFHASAQYTGAGRIYWTETNDIYQDFYGLLNLRAGVEKGFAGVNLWAKNILNTSYTAFYFESMGQNLAQKGKPLTFGVDLYFRF